MLAKFYKVPEFLGETDSVNLITEGGRRFVDVSGALVEVVVVTVNDIAKMIVPGDPGVYIVGTGSSGAAQTFLFLGIVYFIIMTIAAFSYRVPPEGWAPKGWTPPKDSKKTRLITKNNVHIDQALKTPQFYFLWIVLCFNVTAGIGVIGVAKTMMIEIFEPSLPSIVTAGFAGTYVLMISVFNMVGRIFLGLNVRFYRKKNYLFHILFSRNLFVFIYPIYCKSNECRSCCYLPYIILCRINDYFTMYGGGFATIPAYLADIFGTKYVGGIHGRLLTAWSTAGVLGPVAITQLRQNSVDNAIADLVNKISPEKFSEIYGDTIENLSLLVQQKTVTISNLMPHMPEGTINPSTTLYNSTMFAMAALLAVAFVSNLLIGPVNKKHHMKE